MTVMPANSVPTTRRPAGRVRSYLRRIAVREDAANEQPFIAALVISRARRTAGAGFFDIAKELGPSGGDPSSPGAAASDGAMVVAAVAIWSVADLPVTANAA